MFMALPVDIPHETGRRKEIGALGRSGGVTGKAEVR
jgi:hypothetical protein